MQGNYEKSESAKKKIMTGSRIKYELNCKSNPKEVRKIEAVIKKLEQGKSSCSRAVL